MRLLWRFGRRFWRDDRGQSTVEYVVILSATVTGAIMLTRGILRALDSGILRLGGQLEKDLKAGRAPLSVWEN